MVGERNSWQRKKRIGYLYIVVEEAGLDKESFFEILGKP